MDLFNLAKRVKAGVRLLDQKIPNWRTVMRKHASDFDLSDCEYCILGTLEHHSKQMKLLNKRRLDGSLTVDGYHRAKERLSLAYGSEYGFDIADDYSKDEYPQLAALWRAEFE